MAIEGLSKKILIIDGDHDAADLMTELLRLSGYDVICVYDSPSAFRVVENFIPDVVICEIGMPIIDGYKVAVKMRSLPDLKETRLVALTAWGNAEVRAKGIAAGFDAHLIKPANLDAILAQILLAI
ncbi:hypothetical protein AKG95_06970 [Janthinobacterium lividum]|uniref:Response regulatory domain-containing protein n=1 Tax=Janthinobacterium lividum TaxID=29581 RepID=A0A1S1UBE6_9BURK|nr:response regulator [Janthinobacterium lividum]OHV97041.1 hypothetical protein AKG95_06970 [Janthinobacterium lividum]